MPSEDPIDEEDVWDVFDHLIHTQTRERLHLPTEASTADDPEKRCTQGENPANVRGIPVEAIPVEPDRVCAHCLADVNGETVSSHKGGGQETRARIGELVEEMGGTPP